MKRDSVIGTDLLLQHHHHHHHSELRTVWGKLHTKSLDRGCHDSRLTKKQKNRTALLHTVPYIHIDPCLIAKHRTQIVFHHHVGVLFQIERIVELPMVCMAKLTAAGNQ